MIETWKILSDYPEYKISNLGRIYSFGRPRKKFIKGYEGEGYVLLHLFDKTGKQTTQRLHRILAQAFIPNPNNLPEVNHIDGNKLNNDLSNLEWSSYKQNINHSVKTRLRKYGRSNVKPSLTDNEVREIRRLINAGNKLVDIAKQYNVKPYTISHIKNGRKYKGVV